MLAGPGITPAISPPNPEGSPEAPRPVEIVDTDLVAHNGVLASHRSSELAAEGATLYVLSTDAGFQSAIEEAANGDFAVKPIEEWQTLVAEVEAGSAKILLLDADTMRGRVEWRIARLKAAADWSVIMIAADRDRAPYLMELLWQHQIHRLVIKPLGHGVSRILMESAVARYRQLRDDPASRNAPAEDDRDAAAGALARLRPRNPLLLAVYASIVVALAVMVRVAIVPWLTAGATPVTVTDTLPVAAPAVPFAAEIDEALRLAGEAASQGWLTGPQGSSALDYYARVLVYAPAHPVATAEIVRLLDALFGQAEAELLAEAPDLAAISLEKIRRVQPDHSRLAFLDRQLALSREQLAEEPALSDLEIASPLPVVAAIPALSELDSLLTVAEVRLQNGQLLAPAGDSALDYLRRAEVISYDDPIVIETRSELASALSEAARVAFDQGDMAGADQRIAAARELGADEAPLAELDGEIAGLRDAAAAEAEAARLSGLMAAAEDRLERGLLVEPEADNALHFLSALRNGNPGYPNLDTAWQRLIDAVALRVAQSIDAGDWAAAELSIASLGPIAADSEIVSDLSQALEIARRREQFLLEPAAPSELVLVEAAPLEYPAAAWQDSVEGWVEVDFVVGVDGLVTQVAVTSAEPQGVFDQAAIEAVSSYRYEPYVLDGRAYERLLRLRIRFAIE